MTQTDQLETEKLKQISDMVANTLKADFKDVKILRVVVDRDVDFDGDQVLNISVVFEGMPRDIDARVVSGAVRHVRPQLRELGEKAFPLMSFISRRDAGNMALGSA